MLFKNLVDFTNKVDSFPNPFNKPTVYNVLFGKNNNDTIVGINASFAAMLVENDYEIKGLCFFKEKPVIVYDYIESIGDDFYDESKLSKIMSNDYIYNDTSEYPMAWTRVTPEIAYKVKGDSIIWVFDSSFGDKYNFHK